MAKTISQLPDATVVNGSDELIIQQSGITKRATKTEVLSGIVNANIDAAAAIASSKLAQPITLATAQVTTSGTSVDFTGIPTWAKRVTVILSGVSTSGTSSLIIQIGAGGVFADTGYNAQSVVSQNGNATAGAVYTTGFGVIGAAATNFVTGLFHVQLITGNTWIFGGTHTLGVATATTGASSGVITLAAALDRIRLTTVNGTDTFDAGSANIMYEG
jgi:hypothetical protein